jgi:hypothetical protein
MENKNRGYSTIQEYLEKYLYPTLKLAFDGLIEEIKKPQYYDDIVNEFNQNFFENKAKILQKEKELLKLERGSDYSESDYEYFMQMKMVNDTKSENEESEEQKEDFDPDFDDSEMLHLAEQDLNKEEEEIEQKFNPIKFLAAKLEELNLLKKDPKDFDDVDTNTNEGDVFKI